MNSSSNESSFSRPVEPKLRLNEFKILYKAWSRGIPGSRFSGQWWDHLLLGLLYWLEEKIIDHRIKVEVDKAVETVELPPLPDYVTPVYTEQPGEGSLGFSEMRLSAPWYTEGETGVKPLTEASRGVSENPDKNL